MNEPRLWGVYRHFKGDLYVVVAVARLVPEMLDDAAFGTGQDGVVVYSSVNTEETWVRPLSGWNALVQWPKPILEGGSWVPRFTFVRDGLEDDSEGL